MQSSCLRNFLVASEPWKQSLCTPWLPSKCGIIQFSLVWNDGELCWVITSVWANILGTVFALIWELSPENQPRLELWKALVQRTPIYEYLYTYTLRAYDLSISLSVLDYVEFMCLWISYVGFTLPVFQVSALPSWLLLQQLLETLDFGQDPIDNVQTWPHNWLLSQDTRNMHYLGLDHFLWAAQVPKEALLYSATELSAHLWRNY